MPFTFVRHDHRGVALRTQSWGNTQYTSHTLCDSLRGHSRPGARTHSDGSKGSDVSGGTARPAWKHHPDLDGDHTSVCLKKNSPHTKLLHFTRYILFFKNTQARGRKYYNLYSAHQKEKERKNMKFSICICINFLDYFQKAIQETDNPVPPEEGF